MKALDSRRMRRVGGQIGSNPGGIFADDSGKRYYIKTLESAAHARNERLAAKLYQLAGAPTLSYTPTTATNQIATEWIELEKRSIARFTEQERKQAQQWLGVHAWCANWDAAGFNGDNQGVAAGTVITLDLGGALEFRALGDPKGKAFGTQVEELERLRLNPDNPHAIRLFGPMEREALIRAIRQVTEISDTQIRDTILDNGGDAGLATKLLARKADMVRRLQLLYSD